MIWQRAVLGVVLVLSLIGVSESAGTQEGEVARGRLVRRTGLGLAWQSERRGGHLLSLGVTGAAGLDWRWSRRAAFGFDLGLSSFWPYSDHVHEPCLDEPFACHEPTGAVNVASLGATVTYAEAPHGRPGAYVLAGVGLHHALSHPEKMGGVRPGFSVGLGTSHPRDRGEWRIDLRVHLIDDWAGERWVFAPLTFAWAF